MTASAFGGYIAESIRELRILRQADVSNLKKWVRITSDAEMAGYIMAIRDQAWDRLANLASKEIKARRNDLQKITRQQERIARLLDRREPLSTSIKAFGIPIAKRNDWPTIRKQLKQELQKRGISRGRVTKTLDRVESIDEREVRQAMNNAIEGPSNRLNHLVQTNLTTTMGAILALAIARFNQFVVAENTPTGSPVAFCDATQASLVRVERVVWKALREEDLFAAWAYAAELARVAASSLIKCLPYAAAVAIRRSSTSEHFTQNGLLALRLGELIRSLLRAIVLGSYVKWLAKWPKDTSPTRDWLHSARNLPFPSKFKAPPSAPIAKLAARPAALDGKALTIEGVLGSVQIVHRNRKVISFASVSDGNGKMAAIVIPYIKLDSAGMVAGSYVRVSGTWQKQSKEVDGPALLIDRLNLGELGRQSWSDWSTGQLRSIFQATPHGLAVGWSWEPGVDGAGNQLRYGTWFSKKGGRD